MLVPTLAGTSVRFDSKENKATSHAPQLEVGLSAGAQGPAGPQGPPGSPVVIDANGQYVGVAYMERGENGDALPSEFLTALMNISGVPRPLVLTLLNDQGSVSGPTVALYYESADCSGPALMAASGVGKDSGSFLVVPGLLNDTTIYYPVGSSTQATPQSVSFFRFGGCRSGTTEPLPFFATGTIDLTTLGLTLPFHVEMPASP